MNKKLLLITCMLGTSSAQVSFGMEPKLRLSGSSDSASYAGQAKPSVPAQESPKLSSLEAYLQSEKREDRKRIDEPVQHDNNTAPATKDKKKKKEKADFITAQLSNLYAIAHANAAEPVKILMDEATKTEYRVNAAKTAAFIGTECCMFHCCPAMFQAVAYMGLGCALVIAYQDCTAKEKEL